MACTTTWNLLKKKETAGILSNRHRPGRPRKTTEVDNRNIVRNTLPCGMSLVGFSQPFDEDFESSNIEAIPQHANHSLVVRICRQDWFWSKVLWIVECLRLTSTNMIERPKCGERRDLLMIQNIQAHM